MMFYHVVTVGYIKCTVKSATTNQIWHDLQRLLIDKSKKVWYSVCILYITAKVGDVLAGRARRGAVNQAFT